MFDLLFNSDKFKLSTEPVRKVIDGRSSERVRNYCLHRKARIFRGARKKIVRTTDNKYEKGNLSLSRREFSSFLTILQNNV